MIQDPVCGMKADENSTKLITAHKGRLYAFCSISCKTAFEADPEQYVHGLRDAACCSHDFAPPGGCCAGGAKNHAIKSGCACS